MYWNESVNGGGAGLRFDRKSVLLLINNLLILNFNFNAKKKNNKKYLKIKPSEKRFK